MTGDQMVAIIIFGVTFVMILAERIHRTIVAMVGAAVMLIAGMLMGFYSQAGALAAVDFNTLGLLLGMMILVRLLEQTGFFEYIAIFTAKRVGGQPWLLLLVLGGATTVLSMFLDNVTTVVLIVPVTILIAQILGLSPLPLLMAEALLSNIGGVATLVGDPPNVLIGSASGLSFAAFLTHLGPIIAVTWLVAIGILRVVYRRELAERPRNGAALAGLDENASAARSGRCPQDSDRVGCGYPAFLPAGPAAFAAGGRRFDGGSGRVVVGAAGCRGNAAACGVERAAVLRGAFCADGRFGGFRSVKPPGRCAWLNQPRKTRWQPVWRSFGLQPLSQPWLTISRSLSPCCR